ncbi:Cytoskeleton-associated protein 5 [Taenia crassiceps]|uniref:Cytoskeleton-associated protein 5 n=1 Tax=Taenia crassiceps TaxID=6207 RepID=A0ABR4QGA1_9CEST
MAGYDEAIKLLQTQPSEKSNVFGDYVGLLKKIITDSNAFAQEKALDVVLAFVENAAIAPRAAPDVCAGIVNKCMNASRPKTKEKGIEILLCYIELEKTDVVLEEVLKGLSAKQPKVVVGCLQTLRTALSLFGSKIISIKLILKDTLRLLEDRDPNIRNESKELVVEMYRWAGAPIKTQLSGLKPVQLAELENEFVKCSGQKPVPTRYLKSQKPKDLPQQNNNAAATEDPGSNDGEEVNDVELDPYDLADPINILSKLPNDFFEQIEAKKWQDRKEALSLVENLSDTIRLAPGDYGELMKALIKVIAKDTNAILVGQSAKVVAQIANGLRKDFHPYASETVKVCLEKFKEKKPTVLSAVRSAADSALKATTLDAVQEDVIAATSNKVPSVRAETCLYIGRAFASMTVTTLNKKLLKTFIGPLIKCSADTTMEVREASFFAVGTAMFVVTEKNIMPFLADVDSIRLGRIKEFHEKVIEERKKAGTSESGGGGGGAAGTSKPQFKVVKEKSGSAATPAATAKPTTAAAGGAKSKPPVGANDLPREQLIPDDAIESQLTEFFGAALLTELASAVWKERLAAIEVAQTKIRAADSSVSCQLVCRLVMRKPGLKDNNFQVLRMKVEVITEILLARKPVGEVLVDLLLPELIEKIGDLKVGEAVKQAFTALAEATTFEIVGTQVLNAAFQQKSPKNQIEALNWLAGAIKEFGFKLNGRQTVDFLKTGLSATNMYVRQSCIHLSGVLYMYMGATLRTLLADEKPAVIALMEEEWTKLGDSKPPAPTRGLRVVKKDSAGGGADNRVETNVELEASPEPEELVDRTNISEKLSGEVLTLLSSKNWKERKEGLGQIEELLKANPFITGGYEVQEPLTLIAKVCTDVNKILGKTTLGLMEAFAKAFSKTDAKKLVKCVEPSILVCFGDSKPVVREAAVAALSAWKERCGFIPMTENDMLSEALKAENPFLRAELLGWLTTAMSGLQLSGKAANASGLAPDFGLNLALAVYAVCEERNPDARQRAHKILPVLIRSLGYDVMQKALKRLKATSMDAVTPLLEKAREQVTAEDAANPPSEAPKAIRGGGGKKAAPSQPPTSEVVSEPAALSDNTTTPDVDEEPSMASTVKPVGKKVVAKKPAMTSKRAAALEQAEEAAAVVPLQVNKLRETRMLDEKKRKLLKWDFDTPSKDHMQQLNTLFLAAGASPDLHACLFHADFKQHIKAVEILTRLLDGAWSAVDGEAATRANLDLILRWMVLRFFETSPAFLSRGLEYIHKVFSRMSDAGQQLTEYEASAFLPYLVMKVGDSKESIRKDVRAIFRVITNIYAPEKLYPHLVSGLKSKVNKARQECLEEIGSMIEHFGLNVCQPSPAASLKVVAAQISDRDSGVRTAALNALVCAYAIVDEPLWKMLGQLPEKERSMLEERIKRAGRPATATSASTASKRSASERPVNRRDTQAYTAAGVAQQSQQQQQSYGAGGPQSLHAVAYARAQHILSGLGDLNPELPPALPSLLQFDRDINELFKPIEIPELKTRDKQTVLNCLLRTSPDAASAITMVVTQISSNDLNVCCYALSQIDTLLQSDKWQLLAGHINQIITLITIQLRQTNSRFFDDPTISESHLSTVLRCLLVTTESIFKRPMLAREASRESLKEFLFASLHLMVHEKTSELPEGSGIVRAINAITLLVILESNSTRVLGAFIRLLHESVSSSHFNNRFTQVVLRSLWKITKALPDTANNYSLDLVLLDCHNFLKAFPSSSWKTRKSDLPLRTIKTMLHSFCSVRGPAVLKSVDLIPNKEESELESYMKRTLKSLANASGGKLPPALQTSQKQPTSPPKSAVISPETHAKLTSLFAKILSSKDESYIEELYDITVAYPDLDLQPFLADSTPFFQTYIRQALYNVGLRRARENPKQVTNGSVNGVTDKRPPLCAELGQRPVNPKLFMDRLATLRKELGLESGVSDDNSQDVDAEGRLSSGTYGTGNTVMESTVQGGASRRGEGESNAQTTSPPSDHPAAGGGMSQNELMDIRRRLEIIKNAQTRG